MFDRNLLSVTGAGEGCVGSGLGGGVKSVGEWLWGSGYLGLGMEWKGGMEACGDDVFREDCLWVVVVRGDPLADGRPWGIDGEFETAWMRTIRLAEVLL